MKPTPEQIAKLPKWAREAWEQREQELREQLALRWPTYQKPAPRDMRAEVDLLSSSSRLLTGWSQYSYGIDFRVSEGCSNGVNHSTDNTTKTTTQTPGVFYHTKLEALQVARWNMTRTFAKALARVDFAISECQ